MENLTPVQKEIVTAPLGPILVTAGAGSGKTRVLTYRIAHLIDSGIPDYAIVALTFTNKAAKEMRERIEKLRGQACHTFLGTFHGFCVKILREYIHMLMPYTKDFTIYDREDSKKVIKEAVKSSGYYDVAKSAGNDAVKIVDFHISKMKNDAMAIDEYSRQISDYEDCDFVIDSIRRYQDMLISRNSLDFDDLLLGVLDLLKQCPDVLRELQGRYKYILVDEFQDTNKPQYEIVKLLVKEHRNIMVVGDEDQGIYTWRGASSKFFNPRFSDDFGGSVFKLEQNFRSGNNIVSLASDFIQTAKSRISKRLFSELPKGELRQTKYVSDRAEATATADRVVYYVRHNNGKYRDFAVLIRINSLNRVFEEEFRKRNIPYAVWGGIRFFDRAEVKALTYYLRLLVNPSDDIAFAACISMPKRGIGDGSISKLMHLAMDNKMSCLNIVEQIAEDKIESPLKPAMTKGLKEFWECMKTLREALEQHGLMFLAEILISVTGLDAYYVGEKNEDDEYRIEKMQEFVDGIRAFAQNDEMATLSDYLTSVALVGDSGDDTTSNKVIISTVHSAKGLEFKHVFLVGLEEGIFPLVRSKKEEETMSQFLARQDSDMEEEKRLLYVAITRAMKGLEISYSQTRYFKGELRRSRPSRFLAELGYDINDRGFDFEEEDDCNRYDSFTPNYAARNTRSFNSDKAFERSAASKHHSIGLYNEIVKTVKTSADIGFEVGDVVMHDKFGEGEIAEFVDSNIVKVNFVSFGAKMLTISSGTLVKIS